MKNYIDKCPCCGSEMVITRYTCTNCDTEVTGNFFGDKFSRLTEDELNFIEVFVLNRGNIKDVEKALSVSYPTVRNKLDQVIEALGHKVSRESSRIEILSMLNDGQLTAEEATKLLNELE